MTISSKDWNNYISRLSSLSKKAAEQMTAYVNTHGLGDRDAIIRYAYALTTKYGEGSAELACEMYDAMAEISGVILAPAEPAATATYGETAKAINGSLLQSPSGQLIDSIVNRLVKQAASDTTLKNAKRDGAQWAWIPAGDTCAFCLTLASRGWQSASKAQMKGDHATHIHAHCDCQFQIRFNSSTNVEGYDPDALLEQYYAAEGNSSKDRINSLRRMHYKSNGAEVREQKRKAYNAPGNQIYRLARNGNVFVTSSDVLSEYARRIPEIDGYTDIVCHGDEYGFAFRDINGKESDVSAEELCNIIEKAGIYKGGNIRLITCRAAAGDASTAKYVAKRFGVEVMASTETVNVDFQGNMILANDPTDARMGIETGKWVTVKPDGEII